MMWAVYAYWGPQGFDLLGPFDTQAQAISAANRAYTPTLAKRFDKNHLVRYAWIFPITIEEIP